MNNGSKKTLTAFQHITGNVVNNISVDNDNDIAVKKRHEALAVKFFPNVIKELGNNDLSVNIDNAKFDFCIDEVKSLGNGIEFDEDTDEKVESNNFKKYGYTCITLLENSAGNNKKLLQTVDFEKTLKHEKERGNQIDYLHENNNSSISKIKEEIFKLRTKLKEIAEGLVNNTNMMIDKEMRNSKIWRRVQFEDEIKEKSKKMRALMKEQKKLLKYSTKNESYIKSLRRDINNLEIEIKENKIEIKIQKKEKETKNLETKIGSSLSENQQVKLMKKKLKLDKEIVALKQKNDQVVAKIYEEIVLQENYLYFVTTLAHNNQLITEEVTYIENDKNGEPIVWTQIKKYQDINDYEKDDLIVAEISDDNANNFSCITIKKFLLNLETKKNKISKSEWILFVSVTILSIILLATMPVIAPFILAIAWEKALVSAIGVSIGWIVHKGIGVLVADKTKKIEALMRKKFFSWMSKISNKRSIGKTKEELDIKSNINKLTENLKSKNLETKLSTQFSILKSLLNVRKDINANQLIAEWENLKIKNNITSINNKSFDAKKVNDFDIRPAISAYIKKRHFSI